MSDTPRTDACIVSKPYGDFVDKARLVDVARELERELSAVKAERDRLLDKLADMEVEINELRERG